MKTVYHQNRKSLLFSVFGFFLSLPLLASLEFEEERKVVELELGVESITVDFSFRNTGEEAVRILNLSSDCGCTAAMPEKRVFEPEEEGVIPVTFTVGNRSGTRVQRIFLQTDHVETNRHTLQLELQIPVEIELSHRVLQWRKGEARTPQNFRIDIHPESPLQLKDVVANREDVEVQWEAEEDSEGRRAQVRVTPPETEAEENLRFRIDLVFDPESLEDRSAPRVVVFGLVR
ncbi:MAG: DUF1573 domain-containing protein [Opitutales bacterium]|nr:DUF1573 domain-containing protein [Opitutales bacterium]MCH8539703.1 DUF1573 domain-containing protein [Opitutales bacterium]